MKNDRYLIYSLILSFAFISSGLATSITFTFANGEVTGTSPKFYEFDVMANAGVSGTKIGDSQTYVNYNSDGFGFNIAANGKITVSKGTLIQGDLSGDPLYNIGNVEDNDMDRVAITVEFALGAPSFGNDLPTSPIQLLHIKMEIAYENETAGLSFQQSLMIDQQFESDNLTKYVPVIAQDTDDSPLYPTSVSVPISLIPEKFNLYQNYPNPFNPATTLRFDIPLTGSGLVHTRLIIYNSLGQVAKTLYQDELSAGSYEVQWDGTTDFGHDAPSGIYFAIFKADAFSQTRKIVLLK